MHLHTIRDLSVPGRLGSRATVNRLISEGKLEAVKLGRRTLITDESLQALFENLPRRQPKPRSAA